MLNGWQMAVAILVMVAVFVIGILNNRDNLDPDSGWIQGSPRQWLTAFGAVAALVLVFTALFSLGL